MTIYLLNIKNNDNKITYNLSEILHQNDANACDNLNNEDAKICKLKLDGCNDDNCFMEKARFDMDTRLCLNISNDELRIKCLSIVQISSIKQRAVLEDNISICNEFETIETIQYCRDNYYIAKRYNDNNLDYCQSIINEVIKNECIKTN